MNYTIPDIHGWMFDRELQWLYETASTMNSIVEVGSWMGKSTHAILSGCPGLVIAVDTFKGSEIDPSHVTSQLAREFDIYSRFKKNVGHFPNLTVMKMTSYKAAKFFKPRSVDMIFIDGDHEKEAVKPDIISWLPVCRILLCGHDYNAPGVCGVLKDLGLEVINNVDSIWEYKIK